jgi:NIMA (never in mitosis gene a)-related kinase
VYLVRRKIDHEVYALKKVKMTGLKEKERDNSINEIRILASFNSNNLIKFKEAFFDSDSSHLCIVMEYASGGDLLKQIDAHLKSRCRFKEGEIWKAIYDIAKGLKSLHDKKILHRDLKSANIFVS